MNGTTSLLEMASGLGGWRLVFQDGLFIVHFKRQEGTHSYKVASPYQRIVASSINIPSPREGSTFIVLNSCIIITKVAAEGLCT